MSDRDASESELDLDDPWTIWGLEMGRLMRAAGIPPDEDLLQSVASLARLRKEVEAKEAVLPGVPIRERVALATPVPARFPE